MGGNKNTFGVSSKLLYSTGIGAWIPATAKAAGLDKSDAKAKREKAKDAARFSALESVVEDYRLKESNQLAAFVATKPDTTLFTPQTTARKTLLGGY